MLKDFFEVPEIAMIFATKEKDKESVDTNEGSRLRVGKHSRKREHNTKRNVRSKVREHQNSVAMFSARKSKVDNDQRIASLHEKIDYFDFDNETEMIIKKKHSVFNCDGKQSSVENDKPECDIDIKEGNAMEQVNYDLNNGVDANCPSDSAYETNYDDYTGSLERLMIRDDLLTYGDSHFSSDSREHKFGKLLVKGESPYERCRSTAICGRNCEICRGRNNKILPAKHKQHKKHAKDAVHVAHGGGKIDVYHQKDFKVNEKKGNKNYGMFSSKIQAVNVDSNKRPNGNIDSTVNPLGEYRKPSPQIDSQFQQQLEEASNSSSQVSATSLENADSSLRDEENYKIIPYSEDSHIEHHGVLLHPNGLAGSTGSGDYIDQHMLSNMKHVEDYQYLDAFSRGPHLVMLYDFKAEHGDDISVWKGEIVLLLDNRDMDWVWVATENHEEGYVPRSLTAPYSYCEECRQEELRQRQILEKDEVASNNSSPRSMSTNSRSSLASMRSITKYSRDNSLSIDRLESSVANIHMEDSPDKLFSELDLSLDPENPEMNNDALAYADLSQQTTDIFDSRTNPNFIDTQNRAQKQTNAWENSRTSFRKSPGDSFQAKNVYNKSPSWTNTNSRQSSVRSTSSNRSTSDATSFSHIDTLGYARGKEKLAKEGIKLVALSSYQTNEQGKLNVTAGDVVYVHLRDQKVPNWLWVYSPRSDEFGFIPESVVDQLKSSVV